MNNDEIAHLADRVLADLERVPPWSGVSFRGMSEHVTFGREVRSAVASGLVATTRDPRVATENFSSSGIFVILGTQGRAIESVSQFPEEQEVLFLPGSVFVYLGKATYENLPIVIAHQVDLKADRPAPERNAIARRVGDDIRSARDKPPVLITSPGKYVGDLD